MAVTILQGDCRALLPTIADQTFQTCITSPPYWGLRDYGHSDQLGLERDPADYLEHMVGVFREVRRVLRNDGTLWLNMGDSYTDGGRGAGNSGLQGSRHNQEESRKVQIRNGASPFGLGRKQLIGMPWRLALALQADGWYLRADTIWHKTNPMPESCTDRPTRCHEYLFLFSKRARYYYDATAILEPVSGRAHRRGDGVGPKTTARDRIPSGWDTGPGRHAEKAGNYSAQRTARAQSRLRGTNNDSMQQAITGLVTSRNRRSVWTIPTAPFKGAHFATFPPALVRPCVAAGASPRACAACGAPWKRLTRKETRFEGGSARAGRTPEEINATGKGDGRENGGRENGGGKNLRSGPVLVTETIGWTMTCKCPGYPGVTRQSVLDPFGGALTTALVADEAGCDVTTMDTNPEYLALGRARLARQLTIEDATA